MKRQLINRKDAVVRELSVDAKNSRANDKAKNIHGTKMFLCKWLITYKGIKKKF